MTARVTLRPLARRDLDLLHRWMNAPHLVPFYMHGPISGDAVEEKFTPRLDPGHSVRCVIAEADGQAYGYLQWYHNRDHPDWGVDTIGQPDGISIDYYIGDPGYLGRGLGAPMLEALVMEVLPRLAPRDRTAFIGHDRTNHRAIRCTERAGFKGVGAFQDGAKPSLLFRRGTAVAEV